MQATQKQLRNLSVQPGLRSSNDLRVGRKMATFQLFFQAGRAKDLSAPLYRGLFDKQILQEDNRLGSLAEYLSYLHRSKFQPNSCLKPQEAQRQWRISQRS